MPSEAIATPARDQKADTEQAVSVHYNVTALPMTIYFNRDGDHDHNGMMYALTKNVPLLRYIETMATADRPGGHYPPDPLGPVQDRADEIGVELPDTPAQARQPHPLVRPLVLRARVGERITVKLTNEIKHRHVGIHLVAGGYDVREDDGSDVGNNPSSLVPTPPSESHTYTWDCQHEGVFPFHDGGNYSGGEDGTNVHGLFGALIVEPPGATWRDPVTRRSSHGDTGTGPFKQLDGLYLDVLPAGTRPDNVPSSTTNLADHKWDPPQPYFEFDKTSHREFVIFFHDEPEFQPPHGHLEPNPCKAGHGDAGHGASGHGADGHGDLMPIMPISYRAEPMINRERRLWQLLGTGHDFKGRPVLNEEQHHSSWMFGDPVTPILKAYIGDPVRIRFVHAAVKETHVFHLHLYEWHAVAGDRTSPRIDAISVSPQTGHTIEPVWGAGNRHQVAGDVIWHCHLYPHFHEGMWGMFRTFETRQDGETDGDLLADQDFPYTGRKIGRYPDGTQIEKLLPLPGRKAPPLPTPDRPGFPLYIPGEIRQKSPIPPWPDRDLTEAEKEEEAFRPPPYVTSLLAADMPPDFDYRPSPTELERSAFNELPVPGELFTRNPLRKQQAEIYNYDPDGDACGPEEDPGDCQTRKDKSAAERDAFMRNGAREVAHATVVAMRDVVYNSHGWHDKHGHLYYLEAEGDPATRAGPMEPLFLRAQHGQIVNVILRNATPEVIHETEFDHAFPPCPETAPELGWEGECAAHVHMVKFDPICADGAATGWNYISGARHGRRMVYRWWADQEFGTIFFHDHLFANHRQKHGLFGALLVEPAGSQFFHHVEPGRQIVTGVRAMIQRHPQDTGNPADPANRQWFREFCVGIGDFIPMWDRLDRPLNPPAKPGGHGDQGVMGLNYRSAPVRERPGDPANWFSSRVHGDPDTTIFTTYANDPVWIRLVQGSHEEQHSFQVHGLRWRRFRANLDSAIRNQQSLGLAEAFTFINQAPFGEGDYLYKLSGADDLWLGCWGLIRAVARPVRGETDQEIPPLDIPTLDPEPYDDPPADGSETNPPAPPVRRFRVEARQQVLVYRPNDIQDPFGLVYHLTHVKGPDDEDPESVLAATDEPLVLWCRDGERVEIELTNMLPVPPPAMEPEPSAPEVPVERPDRPVSSQVSMHADLLTYDVRTSDGANVGLNPVQTIPPGGGKRVYTWQTYRPEDCELGEACHPGHAPTKGLPLGPLLLQDMADFRNHRHHGLIGALVVLPKDATPYEVGPADVTAAGGAEVWHGARVTVRRTGTTLPDDEKQVEHMVLLMQDGLRLYLNGNPGFPLRDPPEEEAGEAEKEDQGQKGFNYRSEPIGPKFDPKGSPYTLNNPAPATPVWQVPACRKVRMHLVGALDKPRQYSFTIHGVAWPEHRFEQDGATQVVMVSSESAISCGTVRTLEFTPEHPGDHAYRSGVLKWAVPQGMWGILRVADPAPGPAVAEAESDLTKEA
jgi:hypothetical protein